MAQPVGRLLGLDGERRLLLAGLQAAEAHDLGDVAGGVRDAARVARSGTGQGGDPVIVAVVLAVAGGQELTPGRVVLSATEAGSMRRTTA